MRVIMVLSLHQHSRYSPPVAVILVLPHDTTALLPFAGTSKLLLLNDGKPSTTLAVPHVSKTKIEASLLKP